MTSGTIERKCMKGHNKAEGRCSARCVRWYPRIQRATPDGHGRRRFDYLGGYPTKTAARAALDQALGRQGDNLAPAPSNTGTMAGGLAPPTLNDLLDHWLAHLHTNKALRLRTIGRYRQLLAHHLRPYLGTVPVRALTTLQIQRHYDHLAHHSRKDGKPGGLGPRTIRELHLCLRQALSYAMKWHDLPANPAADAEPPAVSNDTRAALTSEQVGMLLAAAHHDRRPLLRAFVVLAATGVRIGELCGLEWHDLDLDAGTVRFRQALSSVDQQLATGRPRPDGTRGKLLVVGPPQDSSQPGRLEPARLRGQGTAPLPPGATSAHAAAAPARPAQPGSAVGRTRPGVAHRARHPATARACHPRVPGLRPRRRDQGASASAAPFTGLGDGGGQGARQRDRWAIAPRRRRHVGE